MDWTAEAGRAGKQICGSTQSSLLLGRWGLTSVWAGGSRSEQPHLTTQSKQIKGALSVRFGLLCWEVHGTIAQPGLPSSPCLNQAPHRF